MLYNDRIPKRDGEMKHLHIVRGVSGSGKTTFARKLGGTHFEADMYFEGDDGSYNFDPSKLNRAHQWCQNMVRHTMLGGDELVVVSNTFTMYWEMLPYIHLAEIHDYHLDVTSLTTVYGNVHDVPEDVIEKQTARFVPHIEICNRLRIDYPHLLSEYYDT